MGLVDVLSITIRPIALAARLYGNIYAGETIIDTMAHMFGPVLSSLCVLPFLAIELLVGFIQALVFLLLTAIFLKLQVGDDNAHGHASKMRRRNFPCRTACRLENLINRTASFPFRTMGNLWGNVQQKHKPYQ